MMSTSLISLRAHDTSVSRWSGRVFGSRRTPAFRVLRGASWNNDDSVNLGASYRNNDQPLNRNDNNGFRVVLVGSGRSASTSCTVPPVAARGQALPGSGPTKRRGCPTCRTSPRTKWTCGSNTPAANGEKTRRARWPGKRASAESHPASRAKQTAQEAAEGGTGTARTMEARSTISK